MSLSLAAFLMVKSPVLFWKCELVPSCLRLKSKLLPAAKYIVSGTVTDSKLPSIVK